MEDSSDWTIMMVTMEDCEDQTMTNEPTLEQTNVQPSTYASAVSVTNSHNHPIKIESFLRDLDLVTPESLRGCSNYTRLLREGIASSHPLPNNPHS